MRCARDARFEIDRQFVYASELLTQMLRHVARRIVRARASRIEFGQGIVRPLDQRPLDLFGTARPDGVGKVLDTAILLILDRGEGRPCLCFGI